MVLPERLIEGISIIVMEAQKYGCVFYPSVERNKMIVVVVKTTSGIHATVRYLNFIEICMELSDRLKDLLIRFPENPLVFI